MPFLEFFHDHGSEVLLKLLWKEAIAINVQVGNWIHSQKQWPFFVLVLGNNDVSEWREINLWLAVITRERIGFRGHVHGQRNNLADKIKVSYKPI